MQQVLFVFNQRMISYSWWFVIIFSVI